MTTITKIIVVFSLTVLISSALSADDALTVDATGNVGIGTATAGSALHVFRDDGSAELMVQESSASVAPRTLVNLQNNGRPEIVMGNTGTGGEWSFGAGTNFVLKQGAVGTTSSAKTKHMTLFATTGNLEISGSITTAGPTCSSGCDAVFSPDYKLPSIAEHARQMYALGHLPNVGPTGPEQRVNLSDQLGNLLNELEHAHIYISQLEQKSAMQEEETKKYKAKIESENKALAERLERLEVLLK